MKTMPPSRRRRSVDVDITPLVDVLFMLIIFFVLTTSFVQGAIDLTLPSGSPSAVPGNPVVLSVRKDGTLFWSKERISREELSTYVAKIVSKSGDIMIAADRDVKYGIVAELMDELQRLGVRELSLAFGGGK